MKNVHYLFYDATVGTKMSFGWPQLVFQRLQGNWVVFYIYKYIFIYNIPYICVCTHIIFMDYTFGIVPDALGLQVLLKGSSAAVVHLNGNKILTFLAL